MTRIVKLAINALTLLIVFVSTVCCSSAARFGVPLTSAKLYDCIKSFVDSTGTRTIVLVPVTHTAKSSHYQKINDYLNTLRAHGYVTFSEGVMRSDKFTDTLDLPLVRDVYDVFCPIDLSRLDTLSRKIRKIMGVNLAHKYDKRASRWRRDKDSEALDVFGDKDYWVDETYADLIDEFEKRFGEIELSKYDLECPLDSNEYKGKEDERWVSCRRNKNGYCNTKLARCILESGFDKIAVVYGYSHIHTLYWFVLPDNGYKLVDNPYYQ